jgi:RNA polymerase sigma factor (sigma-70 family)
MDTGDLVQEAMTKALRRLREFNPRHEGSFQVYMRTTLNNLIRDRFRSSRNGPRSAAVRGDEVASDPSPLETLIGKDLYERYEAALERLHRLRPKDRQLIILRIEFNHSYQEIAEMMGMRSADAARMAVSRALVPLARELKDESS